VRAVHRRIVMVVLCNMVLVLSISYVTVGGLIESRTFVGQLARYGFTANPFWTDLLGIARLKWFDLLCASGLTWGAIAEVRRSRSAAIVNPLIYAAQVAITLTYALRPGSGDYIPPLALAVAVVFGVVPAIGLFLYRGELHQLIFRRGRASSDPGRSGA